MLPDINIEIALLGHSKARGIRGEYGKLFIPQSENICALATVVPRATKKIKGKNTLF
jgi:hypothetical protein